MIKYKPPELYQIFKKMFVPTSENIVKYKDKGKNQIMMFDEMGHVYLFKYFSPTNYFLQKGASEYEIIKSLK